MKIGAFGWLTMFCSAGFAFGGCAAPVKMIFPAATTERPRTVELYVATMIQTRTHFIADGTFVGHEEYPPQRVYTGRYDDSPTTTVRKQPTPARWAAFWRVVDRLQLPAWKPEYAQRDLPPRKNGEQISTTDNADWRVRFSTHGGKRESKGDGAFPSFGRPARTIDQREPASRNGVFALEAAFDELLK